jgi:predicted acylesterase/phospholipase RssA
METKYTDEDFSDPPAVCDIIMKGGITSGVVYPLAIAELAKNYRFAHIGGTSAGAIAAAAAAAAEYGRRVPGKGFMRLTQLPDEVGRRLFGLFQPTPPLRPLFNIFVAAMGSNGAKVASVIGAAISGFRYWAAAASIPGLLIVFAAWWYSNGAFALLGLLIVLIGLIAGVLYGLYRAVSKGLPDNDFGLCPGKSQPGYQNSGLTEWLADLIDDIAGRDPAKDPPLTFADLLSTGPGDGGSGRPEIVLRMMTTNLTLRRPYGLPFSQGGYAFKLGDFKKLFPERVTAYLAEHCEKADDPGDHDDLFKFPTEQLPLVVAARMSLSFPLLFCAVPLYARDFSLRKEEQSTWRKNLFSDGGISSNFPIHFFDRMLPNSPTFGITLDDYDRKRQPSKNDALPPDDPRRRVWLPDPLSASSGTLIPGQSFNGILGFLMRLIDAAKDWQDNLQSTLPGYRDRIVHVVLKPEEGGMNIAMPPELVLALGSYGAQAGIELRDAFDLDEHRWRRFLVAMERLDETVAEISEAYKGQNGIESFKQFLDRYPGHAQTYKEAAAGHIRTLRERAVALSDLADRWNSQPPIPDKILPHPKTELRITPRT